MTDLELSGAMPGLARTCLEQSERNKKFYENNKEEIIKKSNDRLKNLPNEKLQEYRHKAYVKRKDKDNV